MLSSETVFVNAQSKKEEVAEARQKFHSSSGDHITLLKIFRAFTAAETKKVRLTFLLQKCQQRTKY